MTPTKSPEQLAEEHCKPLLDEKEKGSELINTFTNSAIKSKRKTFLAGHSSRDPEVADYREALEFYAGPDCGQTGQSIIKDGIRARSVLDKWSKG